MLYVQFYEGDGFTELFQVVMGTSEHFYSYGYFKSKWIITWLWLWDAIDVEMSGWKFLGLISIGLYNWV